MTCIICESDFDDGVDLADFGGPDEYVNLCPDCRDDISEYLEEGKGKIVVDKCKTCGHIKDILFQDFKPKGRPKGSHNKVASPVEIAEKKGIKTLEAF